MSASSPDRRLIRLLGATAVMLLGVAAAAPAAILVGSPAADVLLGTAGDDTLSGLAGNDRLRGGPGDDLLDGGPGQDDLAGGPGRDAATYGQAPAVTVTLNGLADDGPAGERDNVHGDVEDVYGGAADDRLVGSAGANALDGAAGADALTGGGGADDLFGGIGDDRLDARDGFVDRVDCGAGADVAIVDERDRTTGCEIVDRRPAIPRVEFTLGYEWAFGTAYTFASRLQFDALSPRRASVTVHCTGPGCPARLRRGARASTSNLKRLVVGRRLRPGARLEIHVNANGHVGRVARFRIRREAMPVMTVHCLSVRARRAVACPATAAASHSNGPIDPDDRTG
jgi:hypothetical protein